MFLVSLAMTWPTRDQLAWAMLALSAITLITAIVWLRYRWDHVKQLAKNPLAKYIALSVVAHVVLAIAAYFANVLEMPVVGADDGVVVLTLADDLGAELFESAPPAAEASDEGEVSVPAEATEASMPPAEDPHQNQDDAESFPVDDTRIEPVLTLPSTQVPDALPAEGSDSVDEIEATVEPAAQEEPQPLPPASAVALTTDSHLPENENFTPNPAELQPPPSATEERPKDQVESEVAELTGSINEREDLVEQMTQDQSQAEETFQIAERTTGLDGDAVQPASPEPLRPSWQDAAERSLVVDGPPRRTDGRPIPQVYRDRWDANRLRLARLRGGDERTEAAVRAALRWLASAQSADGRWDASRYGGGEDNSVDGQDRGYAGREADTGITGLALLAFLGAGHTHQSGEYQQVVGRGLQYLLQAQSSRQDGSLVGNATHYAAMYCHGIASLAISEAFALSGDPSLREPMQRAIGFTISTQHSSGGWRYEPHQPGDTSQLGWQLMALTSAHYAGVQIPSSTWTGSGRFLQRVSSGNYGGLASYRPSYATTASMTAEALLCRLLLGTPVSHPLVEEAARYVMSSPPGTGTVNYYYWYYGTLALFHLQNATWDRWNLAMKREVLSRQQPSGTLAGSWAPDSVWGASGGRVYTTALATLTLEVYYRFRPLGERQPAGTAVRRQWTRR